MMKKIAFVSGHFNVLHPGHLRLFKYAKEFAERLVVGVESDELAADSAYISEELRLEGVKSCSYVDEAFVIRSSISEAIDQLKPDIVVKGREFEEKYNPEFLSLRKYGGKLIFSSGDSIFSTSDLVLRELVGSNQELDISPIKNLINGYVKRNSINIKNIKNIIKKFNELRVIVIGDLIIDEYISCLPLGMSQEDATIVVTPIDSRRFLGGAGIVAAHAASLGAKVKFITIVGDDENQRFASQNLNKYNVVTKLVVDSSRPTTQKIRYRSKGKSLLRVSYLHQDPISVELQKVILETFLGFSKTTDLLILSDFNYGCLPQSLVKDLIKICIENNIKVAADSQSSSQIGDISRYVGVDLITPTEREARIAMKNQSDGLVVLAENLRKATLAKNVLLKLGEEGLLVQSSGDSREFEILTDQIPALNTNPLDVSGAGDSLLVVASLAMSLGANIWEMGIIGSLAAAVQVSRIGNIPIRREEILSKADFIL